MQTAVLQRPPAAFAPSASAPANPPGDTPFRQKRAGVRHGEALAWAKSPSEVARIADIRRRRGADAHRAGLAAEDAVARRYARAGCAILARRWRCPYGEIDLIIRSPDCIIFVEVKRRVRAIEDDPVGERQWRRLEAAAETYMIIAETGEAPLRFDLAIVGADGSIKVTKNARC